jgi:hypothetical protein
VERLELEAVLAGSSHEESEEEEEGVGEEGGAGVDETPRRPCLTPVGPAAPAHGNSGGGGLGLGVLVLHGAARVAECLGLCAVYAVGAVGYAFFWGLDVSARAWEWWDRFNTGFAGSPRRRMGTLGDKR